jgi:hypothetical protein
MRVPGVAALAVLAAAVTAATLVGGCATPAGTAAQLSAPAASSTPPASSPNPALSSATASDSPWGSQDTTLAAARRIACGPKPHGSNPGLIRELAHETGPPNPEPTAAPRTPVVIPSPPPVPGQLELEDLTLVPPPIATKPATCVDVALDALRTGGSAPVGAAQPAKVWLAILSAETPAIINPDGSQTPVFTSVLAWVFYFDDLPPMCPAGGPVGPSGSVVQCDPATIGPSSAILSVDATTAEPLTNVESGGPMSAVGGSSAP